MFNIRARYTRVLCSRGQACDAFPVKFLQVFVPALCVMRQVSLVELPCLSDIPQNFHDFGQEVVHRNQAFIVFHLRVNLQDLSAHAVSLFQVVGLMRDVHQPIQRHAPAPITTKAYETLQAGGIIRIGSFQVEMSKTIKIARNHLCQGSAPRVMDVLE